MKYVNKKIIISCKIDCFKSINDNLKTGPKERHKIQPLKQPYLVTVSLKETCGLTYNTNKAHLLKKPQRGPHTHPRPGRNRKSTQEPSRHKNRS